MRIGTATALLLLSACTIGPQYSVYGTDLESRELARALFWPADEHGKSFRYFVELDDEKASPVESLDASATLTDSLDQIPPLGGATVVLPPQASSELRQKGQALLNRLAQQYSGLSTHLVTSAVEWDDVTTPEELVQRVRKARDSVRRAPSMTAFFNELMQLMTPDIIVVPQAGGTGYLRAMQSKRVTLNSDETVQLIYTATTAREIIDSVSGAAPIGNRRYGWIVFLVPVDASAACRQRCDDLLAELFEHAHSSWAILRRTTGAALAEQLTDADALRSLLPSIAEETFTTEHTIESDGEKRGR